MKNINMNINTILLLALSTFMMNGCISKNTSTHPNSAIHGFVKSKIPKVTWKNISKVKKKDCVNCYATPVNNKKYIRRNVAIKKTYPRAKQYTFKTMDYSKLPSASNNAFLYPAKRSLKNKVINTMHYDAYDYTMTANDTHIKSKTYQKSFNMPPVSYVSSYRSNYSTSKTAIQIGAFRKYSGAKIYARKYNALSSMYNVTIKTGVKNNYPLHRVRIEGFSNRVEAKRFMNRYGITEGFFVRR